MNKIVDKLFNFAYKFILIFSIIVFSIALIGSIFFYVNRSYNYFNPILLISGSIIYLFIILRLYKFIINLDDKKKKIASLILIIFQFILLFISTRLIRSIPQVDLIHILTGINSLNNKGFLINNEYFSVYPNNKFLLIILYGLSKISGGNAELIYSLLSCSCITITSFFTYKIVKEMSNINKALISLFICVFSPIFYLYVSYYYTDILMLPFASILIYLIVKQEKIDSIKKITLYGILIGIVSIIGYKIRAVAIFILFAYFGYLILLKRFKHLFKCCLPIFIGITFAFCSINIVENKVFTSLDSSKQFPITHWIMMGVNKKTNGYYSQDDYNLSFSATNVKNRIALNISEIKSRIKNNGITGNLKLVLEKIIAVWGKGDYSYQKYLDLSSVYNTSYDYLIKDKNIVINYLLQISKIGLLFLVILSFMQLYKENKKSLIAISLFLSIVFYIIWEVCPRYGLSFLPWLIIISSYTYDSLEFKLKKIDSNVIIKCIILILTFITLGVSFNKYTETSYRNTLISKDTSKKIEYIDLDYKHTIEQSMVLNRKFNIIKLKFDYFDNNLDTYTLRILNKSKKIIYEKNFTVSELKQKEYTTFKLDKTIDDGVYYINLSTESENPISVALSYKEEFDFYPDGELIINNKKHDGDLMFEVIKKEKRGIYTYLGYMSVMVMAILVAYVVLFKKEEK